LTQVNTTYNIEPYEWPSKPANVPRVTWFADEEACYSIGCNNKP